MELDTRDVGKRLTACVVDVNGGHSAPATGKIARMASMATGEVEHTRPRGQACGEAGDPG